jgi:hypothetical protein
MTEIKETQSEILLIHDPLITPFYIGKDNYGYTIYEKVIPTHTDSKVPYVQTHGHYSNFGNVLLGVAALKTNKKSEYNSIVEYLNEFKKIQKTIEKLLDLGI